MEAAQPAFSGPRLRLSSRADLARHEEEILARIAHVDGGGVLFVAHPFRFLSEIGVEVSGELKAELIAREPQLEALADEVYEAVKAAPPLEGVEVRIHRLFGRDDHERTRRP